MSEENWFRRCTAICNAQKYTKFFWQQTLEHQTVFVLIFTCLPRCHVQTDEPRPINLSFLYGWKRMQRVIGPVYPTISVWCMGAHLHLHYFQMVSLALSSARKHIFIFFICLFALDINRDVNYPEKKDSFRSSKTLYCCR